MKIQSLMRRALCASAFLLGVGSVQKADASTFRVDNTADSGPGSLRQAILNANSSPSDDTIIFDNLALNGMRRIDLTTGELRIANRGRLTLSALNTFVVTVSGNYASRILNIDAGANVTLSNLTFDAALSTGGGSLNSNGLSNGGAIFNRGQLTINNCRFEGNTTDVLGNGGAIYSTGRGLTINNTVFSGNTAYRRFTTENGQGGAIYNAAGAGPIAVSGCTFLDNYSSSGGAIYNASTSAITIDKTRFDYNRIPKEGGAILSNSDLTISNSSFSNNDGWQYGGAICTRRPEGQATFTVRISNSTFTGNNSSYAGGALYNAGNNLSIDSCTLVGNDAGFGGGGGIFTVNADSFTLNNSIVALNQAAQNYPPNIEGPVTNGDYNLVDDTTGTTLAGSHNIVGKDPKLGRLTDNGGLTSTLMLLAGSPAIDAGFSLLPTDQRGSKRPLNLGTVPRPTGNGSDIGAVEVNQVPQTGLALVVNSADDHNDGVCGVDDCTLREALIFAKSNREEVPYINPTVITFDPTVFGDKRTIEISTPLPDLVNNVNIIGPTAPGSGVTVSASPSAGRVFYVTEGWATLSNLTLKSEIYTNLIIRSGTVTVNSCTFDGGSRGIQAGDVGASPLNLTVNNSTFFGHTEVGFASGAKNVTATFDSCTLAYNARGILVQEGVVHLKNSVVAGNGASNLDYNNGKPLASIANSIVTGTGSEVGLDPDGLKDNGGPTPTIALLEGSRAINTGATTLATDQRGIVRDSLPDIGAFEGNSAPRVVSVTPQGASDRVGAKRTFSVTVSDANGLSDIKEMWLLINDQLSWGAGATLIYVPSAQSPTKGSLYLRRDDAFLPPAPIGVASKIILDNGVVSIVAREVKVSVSGNAVTLSVPMIVRDGLVGQNQVFARVVDRADATDPAALAGDGGYRRFGTYTVTPQFSDGPNQAPTLSRLNPALTGTTLVAAGVAPTAQTFTFAVKDENGTGDIESLWFMAGKERSWTNSATFIYVPRSRRLYLRSDDGNSFLGGGIIGTGGIIENSQVRLDLSKVKTTIYPDGKTLALSLPLQAKSGLIGQNNIWLRTQDTLGATAPNGDDQGYVLSGSWNVRPSAPPRSAPNLSAGHS